MAKLEYKAECLCGGQFICLFKKPTQMQISVYRSTCSGCGSRFLFSCEVGVNEKGRYYKTDHEVMTMTDSLKEIVRIKKEALKEGATNEHRTNT